MDILQYLKKDHQAVADLLDKIEETTDRAEVTRKDLFAKVQHELGLHAEFEETRFYPTLKENDISEDITREGYEEHHVIKVLLAELEALDKTDAQWLPKLIVLKEIIAHHVEEEEKEMFPKAKKVYSSEELTKLGEEIEEFKKANQA